MARSLNSDVEKCRYCQGNESYCLCKTDGNSVDLGKTLEEKNCSLQNEKKLTKNQKISSGIKHTNKWRKKFKLFCHDKAEKKIELKVKEIDKTETEKSAKKESEKYESTISKKEAAIRELLPHLKDITKLSTGTYLNSKIVEQRLELLKKSYTLPSQLNGISRSENSHYNTMEVLTENENTSFPVSPVTLRNGNNKIATATKEIKNAEKDGDCEPMVPNVTVTKQVSTKKMISACSNHDGKRGGEILEAVLFCGVCLQTVCYKCAFEKHKDHKVTPIQVAAENIRINLAERKRKIETTISQMRTKRKSVETSNDELQQRIHAQFEQVVERLHKKEAEVMEEVEKLKQKRVNLILGLQNQHETAWGQVDAVLRTEDDAKMLEEYNGLTVIEFNIPDNFTCSSYSPMDNGGHLLWKRDALRTSVDLNRVQDEIEKICLAGPDLDSNIDNCEGNFSSGLTPRQGNKRFSFKLDNNTAHAALRVAPSHTAVEYVGSERNGVNIKHVNVSVSSTMATGNPYNAKYPRIPKGLTGKLKRTQFATVLGDSSITQGKQYWEVSVNRSMEYRLGVAYKHMQGTKSLADEHNCWALCLTYPDRFSAIHKHHKDYIFIPTHTAVQTSKVIRIGIFLDYERGVLSFYNASTAAEKKHLYTFRTFFNRPVWPLLSLRQGKLQILTGLPVPRNLVWKTR